MVGKNNSKQYMENKGSKKQRFTIRKLSVGVASVSVGAMLLIPNGALSVSAEEADVKSDEEAVELIEDEAPVEEPSARQAAEEEISVASISNITADNLVYENEKIQLENQEPGTNIAVVLPNGNTLRKTVPYHGTWEPLQSISSQMVYPGDELEFFTYDGDTTSESVFLTVEGEGEGRPEDEQGEQYGRQAFGFTPTEQSTNVTYTTEPFFTVEMTFPDGEVVEQTANQQGQTRFNFPDGYEPTPGDTFSVNVYDRAGDLVDLNDSNLFTNPELNQAQISVAGEVAEEPVELPRPEGVSNQQMESGTTVYPEDFLSNADTFPEGTTFAFHDYNTGESSESLTLDVAPNPDTNVENLVIRATHPDAEDYVDSYSFSVIIEASDEAPAAPEFSAFGQHTHLISIDADPNTDVTLTFTDGTELTQTTNSVGNVNFNLPEDLELNVGDTVTAVATDEDGQTSETASYEIPDAYEITNLTVDPILPGDSHENITGTAVPGAYVTAHLANGSSVAGQADENGNFTIDSGFLSYAINPGDPVDFSVAVDGEIYRFFDVYSVEDAPALELPRPEGLTNERLPHGETIYAEDFVTNLEEFPEGTTFEFYDYDTQTGTESLTLDVGSNPEMNVVSLVIRATHPDVEDYTDSFSFSVVVEAPNTVTLDPNGGTIAREYEMTEVNEGDTYSVPYGFQSDLAREGYTLTGYTVEGTLLDAEGNEVTEISQFPEDYTPQSDVTLTANWEETAGDFIINLHDDNPAAQDDYYTVTLMAEDGTEYVLSTSGYGQEHRTWEVEDIPNGTYTLSINGFNIIEADGGNQSGTTSSFTVHEDGTATVELAFEDDNTSSFIRYDVQGEPEETSIELPRPEGLSNQRLPHGETIYAEDFVTNLEEFPEGTMFEFYDYDTQMGTESLTLDVGSNPDMNVVSLVIRATHPDAENYTDSFSFSVIVEAQEVEAQIDPIYEGDTTITGTGTPGEMIRISIDDASDTVSLLRATPLANTTGLVTIDEDGTFEFSPLNYSATAGETITVTWESGDGRVLAEQTVQALPEEVDTSALEDLIAEAEAITNEDGQYTEKSFAALQDAIDDAWVALATVETQEDVDEAVNVLQAAIDGLEEGPTDPEDDRLTELEDRLAELEEAARRLQEQNEALAEEIAALQAELAESNAATAALEERVAELEARLAALEEAEEDSDQVPGDDQPGENDEDQSEDTDDFEDPEEVDNKDEEKLPETGAAPSSSSIIAGVLSILSGLGLMVGKKSKKDE